MSAIMRAAFEQRQQMRDDFELTRNSQYERAMAELRGELLNRRGRENHIDPYSLFMGPVNRAMAYASEELLEWWQTGDNNRRWTVEQYERQWMDDQAYGPDEEQ